MSLPSVMSDSKHSSTDEKATVVAETNTKGGFFARRRAAKSAKEEKLKDGSADGKPAVPELAPVAFTQLFR